MRNGSDINARTSHDETVFRFTVPTHQSRTLDTALTILADMAHDVTFDSAQARTEGGIVFAEWRSRQGAGNRLAHDRDAVLLGSSRYAARPVIGDTSVLRKFDVGAMRRFYERWYRPELMAVVAVGDFDAARMEKSIKEQFGSLPASATRTIRPAVEAPAGTPSRAATLHDD